MSSSSSSKHHVVFILFFSVSFADEFPVNFTLKPKDAEYFVGREAIFRWGYHIRNSDNVESIQFGKVAPPEDDASAIEYVAILVKDLHSQGKVKRNNKYRTDVISYVSGRTSVIENETASFKIVNLTLNDTGKYYCRLQLNNSFSVVGKNTDCVQLKVVGKSFFSKKKKSSPFNCASIYEPVWGCFWM